MNSGLLSTVHIQGRMKEILSEPRSRGGGGGGEGGGRWPSFLGPQVPTGSIDDNSVASAGMCLVARERYARCHGGSC